MKKAPHSHKAMRCVHKEMNLNSNYSDFGVILRIGLDFSLRNDIMIFNGFERR